MEVYSCPNQGDEGTWTNNHRIFDHYDIENEKSETKKLFDMSNQFIHAYTSFVFRDEARNWSDIYVVSDFDRNDYIWHVPIQVIRKLFKLASDDYPSRLMCEFDEKTRDYEIATD